MIIFTYHFSKNLRSEIFRCSTQGLRRITFYIFLTQTKVCNTNVAFRIQKKVFRFQVAVDNLVLVEMSNAESNLCSIELGTILVNEREE